MCGIAGIFAFTETGKRTLPLAGNAVSPLKRRGPDADGIYMSETACLVHTRLSIIDTSESGSQPFTDDSGRYTLIFNGEFFNYEEYRDKLLTEGVQLHSQSDTEVLLHLLIRHGEKAIPMINGFFSFAFFDKAAETMIVARDRFGIKPLYYYCDHDRFCFASELKGLKEFDIPTQPDHASLRIFFHLNYIPDPWTAYEGVKKLDPGTYFKISVPQTVQESYYTPNSDGRWIGDYREASDSLASVLEDSVKLRLVSDVPLGCFLSGGIDSSVIAALASKHTSHLKTFSIGFADEPYFDETKYARLLAKKHHTDHTEFSLRTKDLLGVLDEVLEYPDEPFADSSALAVYILSRETRKHVTVALSGDGADELFGGYNKHAAELRASAYTSYSKLAKSFLPVLDLFPSGRNSFISNKARQAKKFISGLQLTAADRYWDWAGFADENSNYLEPGAEYMHRRNELTKTIDSSDFNTVLKADVRMVLAGDMLTKVDRMSMANSLEVRCPFLDYRVVDLAFSMPSSFKIDSQNRKKIVKDTFASLLPAELLNRRKQGFEVPLLKWFRADLKNRLDHEVFNEKMIRDQGILDADKVLNVKKQLYSSNPGDAAARTYALLSFQSWYKSNFH